jgi:FSR family fosmidomycin resistance protein-like MFS transporter
VIESVPQTRDNEPDGPDNKARFRLGAIAGISFGHLAHDTFPAFLPALLPLLIEDLGLSYTLAGMLTLFLRMPSLANPFIGALADKISIRAMVIVAPAVTASIMSLLPNAPSYPILIVMLLAAGISSACFHVPAPVVVGRLSGSKMGMGMSIFMLSGELARSLGPILILAAISLWGLQGTFRLIPLGLSASVILFFMIRRTPMQSLSATRTGAQLLQLWRNSRLFLILAGILFSKNVIIAALTAFLPTYLVDRGSSLWLAGASLSIVQFFGALGSFTAGSLSDRLGRRNMLLVSSAVTPLVMVLFLLVRGWMVLPILAVLGLFSFAVNPVLMALVQENAPTYPSVANGMFMTLGFVTISLCTFGIGLLADRVGLEITYRVCALASLIGIPVILLLPARPAGSWH